MITIAVALSVFAFGAIIGSFLNVCIYRLPRSQSIVMPPSHCPACNKNVLWHDNIPVLSFLLLRGRCRYCKAPISPRYILVESLTGLVFAGIFLIFGYTSKTPAYAILASALIAVTFIDLEFQVIPDLITLTGLAAGIIISIAFPYVLGADTRVHSLLNSLGGILFGGGSIFLLGFLGKAVFKKEAMGEGDIFLLAMIGAFLGWKYTMLTFFIAPIFGSIAGVAALIRGGSKYIPYGPYLSLAALCSLVFGGKIFKMLFFGL